MQLPLHHDNCICNNYLFCSSSNFFNLSISASFASIVASFSLKDALRASFCASSSPFCASSLPFLPSARPSHPSSCRPSTLPYSCPISLTPLKHTEHLPRSFQIFIISRRTDSRSGNISINLSISCGVSATNNDRYFNHPVSSSQIQVHHYTDYCHNRNPLS